MFVNFVNLLDLGNSKQPRDSDHHRKSSGLEISQALSSENFNYPYLEKAFFSTFFSANQRYCGENTCPV